MHRQILSLLSRLHIAVVRLVSIGHFRKHVIDCAATRIVLGHFFCSGFHLGFDWTFWLECYWLPSFTPLSDMCVVVVSETSNQFLVLEKSGEAYMFTDFCVILWSVWLTQILHFQIKIYINCWASRINIIKTIRAEENMKKRTSACPVHIFALFLSFARFRKMG